MIVHTNSVNYLQALNFSQLFLWEKTKTKNLGLTTPNFVISQSSSNRKQTREKIKPCCIR